MPRGRRAYPLEFRQRIVELVRVGRRPGELAREFEPTVESINRWVKQSCPKYVPSFTARTVGRLTRNARAAALTEPPLSRKSRTARSFSESSAGGLPPVLPSAAARSTPALIRSRMVSRSHSARESSMWSMRREVGLSSSVSRPSARERMWMPWACSSSMVLSPSVRFRAAVQPWDHDDVAGLELFPERHPRGAAHVPARSHVGEDAVVPEAVVVEDAALGGQPARALRLGDPDVAEDRWVHVATSPRGNQTPVCLPLSVRESIRIWAG